MSAPEGRAPVLGVGGVVIEPAPDGGRVLVIKRANPPRQGAWSLPGGRVERGELLADALRREMLEETGLVVEPGELVSVVEILSEAHHFVVLDYLCTVAGGTLRAGDDAAEAQIVPIASLKALGVSDAVLDVVARAEAMVNAGARRIASAYPS